MTVFSFVGRVLAGTVGMAASVASVGYYILDTVVVVMSILLLDLETFFTDCLAFQMMDDYMVFPSSRVHFFRYDPYPND